MDLLSISQTSAQMGMSIDALRRWDKSGIIRAIRDSRDKRFFDRQGIEALIAKRDRRVHGDETRRHFRVLNDPKPSGFTSVDFFAGASDTALGLENAGFRHVLLSELDKDAVATLQLNCPNWNVSVGDMASLDFRAFVGKVDLMEDGFPCQAFSYAGHSRGFEDTHGTLFFGFACAVSETTPKVFIGENMRGLLHHDPGRTLQTMLHTLTEICRKRGERYRVGYCLMRAQYHNIPQKRERLMPAGVRSDIGDELFFPREHSCIVSLWDAIGDRPQSPGQTYPQRRREVSSLVPPGGYWRDLPNDIAHEYLGDLYHLSRGKTGMARCLSWDEPSLTLTCSPAQKQTERCHPEETRPLNVREYARVQTFPDDRKFSGVMSAQYEQIGSAVPVNLVYYMGKCAAATLGDSRPEILDFAAPASPQDYVN